MRLLLLIVPLLIVAPAAAQVRAPAFWTSAHADATLPRVAPERPSAAPLMVGGLVGGATGLLAGGLVGFSLEMAAGCESEYFCGLGGAILGALAGELVMLPLGVHLANGGRGSLVADVLVSAAAMGAGLLLAGAAASVGGESAGAVVMLSIPVAQIVAVSAVEARGAGR